jgi:hypothetical protein
VTSVTHAILGHGEMSVDEMPFGDVDPIFCEIFIEPERIFGYAIVKPGNFARSTKTKGFQHVYIGIPAHPKIGHPVAGLLHRAFDIRIRIMSRFLNTNKLLE